MHGPMTDTFRHQVVTTILLAGGRVLTGNMKRVGLIIGAPPTNRFTLSFESIPALDAGLNVYPASQPLYLDELMIGSAIREDIFGISAVADQNLYILEILRT